MCSIAESGVATTIAPAESIFATLKKEKVYQLKPKKMTIEQMNSEVWRFVQYYNRQRVCTFNEGGYPPSVFRERNEAKQNRHVKNGEKDTAPVLTQPLAKQRRTSEAF